MSDELWPSVAWLMAGTVGLGVGLATVLGILSSALVLDLAATWPLAGLAVATALGFWRVRRRRFRLMAIPGLLMLSWIVLTLAAHLSAVDWLPSTRADIAVSAAPEVASVQLEVDRGTIAVAGFDGAGYSVRARRTGGRLGPPSVSERISEGRLDLVVVGREPGPWFRFGGWEVALGERSAWSVDLTAPIVSLDTRDLAIDSASVRAARGDVWLGPQSASARLDLTGDVTLHVAAGTPITVVGAVVAPPEWKSSASGATSPGHLDPLWEVVVRGDWSVTVVEDG